MSCVHHHHTIFKDAQPVVILVNLFAQNHFVKKKVCINAHLIPFAFLSFLIPITRAGIALTEQQMRSIAHFIPLDLIMKDVVQNDTKSTTTKDIKHVTTK